MTTGHNHEPICCCPELPDATGACPLCPHHGELAQLAEPQPGQCPICKSEIGRQHTDYCQFTGPVMVLPMPGGLTAILDHNQPADTIGFVTRTGQPITTTSQPTTHTRSLHVNPNPHPRTDCSTDLCGQEPLKAGEAGPTIPASIISAHLDSVTIDGRPSLSDTRTCHCLTLTEAGAPFIDPKCTKHTRFRTPGYDGPEGTEWDRPAVDTYPDDDIDITTTRNPNCTCRDLTTIRTWYAPRFHHIGCPTTRATTHLPINQTWHEHPISECSPTLCGEPAPTDDHPR